MLHAQKIRQRAFFSIYLRKISLIKVLFVLFVLGMIYGAALIGLNQDEALGQLGGVMQRFISKRAEQSVIVTLISSFSSSMVLIIILFLIGFFSIGQPIAFFVPVFQGLGVGLSTAYLYSSRGVGGVLFCLLLIVPSAFISTFALILGSRESIRFSSKNLKTLFPQKFNQNMKGELGLYLKRFAALTFFQATSAIVDAICTFLFARFLL